MTERQILYTLTNWTLLIVGLANLCIGTLAAYHQAVGLAATALTAGLVLLFSATIDRFESLKGLGVEAKTRQLNQKIEQADEALTHLKLLAELTCSTLIDLNSKIGRWSVSPTPAQAEEVAQRVRSILEGLGSDSATVRSALEPWALMACHDLAVAITRPVKIAADAELQRIEQNRAGLARAISPEDPAYIRWKTERTSAYEFQQRFTRIYEIALREYPERVLALFENAPVALSDMIGPVRTKAQRFAPDMRALRDTLKMQNREAWFREIEEFQKTQ
jgi:hypothetical protein